jgi:hypothetical protein
MRVMQFREMFSTFHVQHREELVFAVILFNLNVPTLSAAEEEAL